MPHLFDLSKFENKRILIIGDIILDEFVYTTSSKNSPEYKNVPVLQVQNKIEYLGGAANVALNIKKLKAIPYLIGTVGDDISSKTIYGMLHKEDITNLYIHTDHRAKTTKKTRVFQNKIPVFRLDEEDHHIAYTELANHFLLKNIHAAITDHKPHAVILQDYNKGVLNASVIPEILAIAKQHHLLVCVDPKFDNWELYKDADLFKPNAEELKGISIKLNLNTEDLEKTSIALQQKIQFKNLLVTLGSEGNFIFDGTESVFNRQSATLELPDVCGAGDTVIAVATLALACGFSLAETAFLSNKAGYISCGKENVQPVTLEELSN